MIHDAIAAALPEMRAHALSRMTSTCLIRHRDGTVLDAAGRKIPAWATVGTFPCRLAGPSRGAAGSRTESPPGGEWEQGMRTLHLPHGSLLLRDSAVVEMTAGESAGTFWQVIDSDPADQRTAYRVSVKATTRPEGW